MKLRESEMPEEAYWEGLFDVEAARIVRPGGFVHFIHWRYDAATPRGPSMEIRLRPEQIIEWAGRTGLLETAGPILELPPWHYGIRLQRRAAASGE